MMLPPDQAVEIERAMAEQLGRILFAYSRLDVNLGLHLVWSDAASRLSELSERYSGRGLGERLAYLKKCVAASYAPDSPGGLAYADFFDELDSLRMIRNDLVHGRWGPPLDSHEMECVVGLPTTDAQRARRYSPSDLGGVLQRLQDLQMKHEKLRNTWPLQLP